MKTEKECEGCYDNHDKRCPIPAMVASTCPCTTCLVKAVCEDDGDDCEILKQYIFGKVYIVTPQRNIK